MEKQIEKLMSLLGCDEETAKQIIEDDKKIDKGEKLFELSNDQKAVEKQCRQAPHEKKPMIPNLPKKERKADDTKRGLIELLAEVIKEQSACNGVEITNKERQIDFEWGGRKLRIVLSAPRK